MKLVAVCGAETTPVLCVFARFVIFFSLSPLLSGVSSSSSSPLPSSTCLFSPESRLVRLATLSFCVRHAVLAGGARWISEAP